MKNLVLWLVACLSLGKAFALTHLKDDYLITYGNPQAPVHVIHYFSFLCPNCSSLFQREFRELKKKYIDTDQIYWTFHPAPIDMLTLQGMECLQKLSLKEKQIFLEAILEETNLEDPSLCACLMEKAMDVFKKPLPELQNKSYLSSTASFQDAYLFISQKDGITAVPTVEMNGKLYLKDVPDSQFIEQKLKELISHEKDV